MTGAPGIARAPPTIGFAVGGPFPAARVVVPDARERGRGGGCRGGAGRPRRRKAGAPGGGTVPGGRHSRGRGRNHGIRRPGPGRHDARGDAFGFPRNGTRRPARSRCPGRRAGSCRRGGGRGIGVPAVVAGRGPGTGVRTGGLESNAGPGRGMGVSIGIGGIGPEAVGGSSRKGSGVAAGAAGGGCLRSSGSSRLRIGLGVAREACPVRRPCNRRVAAIRRRISGTWTRRHERPDGRGDARNGAAWLSGRARLLRCQTPRDAPVTIPAPGTAPAPHGFRGFRRRREVPSRGARHLVPRPR